MRVERGKLLPVAGYSRFRKQRVLGRLKADDDEDIMFRGHAYKELVIRSRQVTHNCFAGLGAYVQLGMNIFLYADVRYHRIFRNTSGIKLRAFDYEGGTFVESLITDDWEQFRIGDREICVRDKAGNTPENLYNIGQLSFSVQIVIPFSERGGGPGYSPKKFMGTQ